MQSSLWRLIITRKRETKGKRREKGEKGRIQSMVDLVKAIN